MSKKYNFILKFNPKHAPSGSSQGGQFSSNTEGVIAFHKTRYNFAIEKHMTSRIDLGHFRDKVPRSITSKDVLETDPVWQGAEDALIASTSEAERKKLTEFTGATLYRNLTKDMHAGKTSNKEIYDSAKLLHSSIQKSSLPEDITLFRGMKARGVFTEGSAAIGKVYDSKAFQSTSLLQDNAIQFATGREPACIIRIKAKKGQKGAYLDGKLSQNPQEQEVLLPHNAKFIITGHSLMEVGMGKSVQKMHVYEVEYL